MNANMNGLVTIGRERACWQFSPFRLRKAPQKNGTSRAVSKSALGAHRARAKLADGTPDLSGVWLGSGGSDADIANPGLESGRSGQHAAMGGGSGEAPPIEGRPGGELFAGRHSARIAVSVEDRSDPKPLLHSLRRQHPQLPADLHECQASRRSRSHLVRPFDRPLGRKHVGGRYDRVQRQILVRL